MVGLWFLGGGEVSLLVVAFGTTAEGGRELLDKVIMVTPPPPFLSFAAVEEGRLPFLSLMTALMVGRVDGWSKWVEPWVGWVWFQLLKLGWDKLY